MAQCRNTHQKQLILRLLAGNKSHPTADEIYELARAQDPRISRGTVYRNLSQMAENGELLLLAMPGGPNHFDPDTHEHYHFLCRACQRVFDTAIPYNAALNATPPELPGFLTEHHRLLLIGLCPDCGHSTATPQ